MFRLDVVRGTTDVSVPIMVIDSSDGTPETGYDHTTTGIDLWYRRQGGAEVAITEAALAAWNSAHTDGGVEHGSDGRGRLDLPDAACAVGTDGATYVEYGGTMTGMIVIGGVVQLTHETALSGLFSGTHTTTSADLGTNAPANSIIGMTLYFPADKQSRIVETYNTGTGVAGWTTALASAPVNNEPWELFPTAPIDTVTLGAINAQVDTAFSDYDPPTRTELTTDINSVLARLPAALVGGRISSDVGSVSGDATAADNLEAAYDGTGYDVGGLDISELNAIVDDWINGGRLDTLLDSVITALGTAQADLDLVTGSDGATLATAQANYAPSKAGDQMDLVDAPNSTAVAAMVAAYLAGVVEGTTTVQESMALMNAAAAGKVSGAAGTSVNLRNLADTLNRIAATVDADGNRSAVTLTFTDL